MYKMDLLKGEGVPIRSRPGGIAFACMVIAMPLIVGSAIASIYLEHRVAASVQSQQLNRLRKAVATLSAALETKRSLEERRTAGTRLLGDIKTALIGHTQWSPILTTVIDCMPDNLILTKLEARQESVRRRVPAKDNPETSIDVDVPMRTLQIGVFGYGEQTAYRAVRNFQDQLRSSAMLAPRLDTLTISQESQTRDGQEIVSYELNCAFRPAVE
jgi:hypothetical protein